MSPSIFADPEEVQEDLPSISTPEHWSDVGPLNGRLGLVEQQMQTTQAQLLTVGAQLAQLAQNLQQLELSQRRQEEILKLAGASFALGANGVAANATGTTGISATGAFQKSRRSRPGFPVASHQPSRAARRRAGRRARPGPRERQRMRQKEAEKAAETWGWQLLSEQPAPEAQLSPGSDPEPEKSAKSEVSTEDKASTESSASEVSPCVKAEPEKTLVRESSPLASFSVREAYSTQPEFCGRRLSWVFLAALWLLYLLRDLPDARELSEVRDLQPSDLPRHDQQSAWRLRELGHLQLAVSDCRSAADLFLRSERALNGSRALEELSAVRRDRGFALVCAQEFHEAVAVLREDHQLPPHLLNALAAAYFHLGDFYRAAHLWERALQQAPENPLLWNNLGAAQILLGDLVLAERVLLEALPLVQRLAQKTYYMQLVSNNIHTQRRHAAGQKGYLPRVEIFNCVASDVSIMVHATPTDQLQKEFQSIEADAENLVSPLAETSTAVLAAQREPLLCP
ncbi:unnamed protein product [Effrenium voratum]|uniref:Uncharacterized protein n=1 Tax=Effrenium voratum TaxID=2562239 RepID=A0AA36JC73_9DINO|nr:unnamed protein product [Effrenium voratum]